MMREFSTGATRDAEGLAKLDYEGFLSPLVLRRFAEYMNKNRVTAKGVRDSDNWQKGIPNDVYMKSLMRHTVDIWLTHREHKEGDLEEELCAVMFNSMGYLHELLKAQRQVRSQVQTIGQAEPSQIVAVY